MNNYRKVFSRQKSPVIKLLLLLPLLLAGCLFDGVSKTAMNSYYINPHKQLNAIGKVAVLELNNNSSFPQVSVDVTDALFMALQKKQIFSLMIVRRNDPAWRNLQLDGDSTYSLEQLLAIRKTLNCNAVLAGTITQYKPYPHVLIGLRLRMVDLNDGQLIWAFEQVWDGTNKATESRIKNYFQNQIRSNFAPLNQQLIIVSPLEFIKFVAYEVAETLKSKK